MPLYRKETEIVNNTTVVGDAGQSAYQIAVRLGFQGTEQQWLESLKGDKGDNGTFALPTTIKTVSADNDFLILFDSSGNPYRITKANLLTGLSSGGTTTPTPDNDDLLSIFGNDLVMWYRADNAMLDGSNAKRLIDKSSYQNDTFISTDPPLYSATGFNNKPCIDFRNNGWFQLPNVLRDDWGQATIIILLDLKSTGFWSAMKTGYAGDAYWGTGEQFGSTSFLGELRASRLEYSPNSSVINTVGKALLEISSTASDYLIHRNSVLAFETTPNFRVTSTPYLGRDETGRRLPGLMAEFAIIKRSVSLTERQRTRAYLKKFWELEMY
ncbi:hypothetical protein WDZ92_06425 [Nostoc sp. NIES-2111]